MKIEHVAMYVKDLEQVKWFLENYFGAKSNAGYHNESTDFQSYFLTFDDDARLEIMSKPGLNNTEKNRNSYGYIHVAFSVGSEENVNQLTKELKEAGYKVLSGPRTTGDGYYESCIVDMEGNQIEITI